MSLVEPLNQSNSNKRIKKSNKKIKKEEDNWSGNWIIVGGGDRSALRLGHELMINVITIWI